ncbi:MAG: haloacid dehalogenase-like hydrolase [Kiritimatiellae bacterium]|nr:haloacid dehalogenase-like hydrolase [Kiritimatiellia bacterium]
MRKVFLSSVLAAAFPAFGAVLPKGEWHAPVHAAVQAAIDRHAGDPDAYVVFDFDMTCPIGDCGHCTLAQAIRELAFAFSPDEAEKVFLSDVPDPDIPLDPALPNATLRNVVLDCADLHRELLEMTRGRPLAEVRRTEAFTAFASKVRFLRKRVPRTYGSAFGYPWNKRFYSGMTRAQFAELVHRGIDEGAKTGFMRGCWRTPERYAGRSGAVEVPMLLGFTVPREITELLAALRASGISVYVASGSFYDKVVAAADPRHGTGFSPDEILGEHIQADEQGRLTGRHDARFPFPWAAGKPDVIRQRLAVRHHGRDPIMVLGDSDGDYAMLTAFTNMEVGVIFNTNLPQSSRLGKLCADILAGRADPRFVLQGRDEVRRTLRPHAETVVAPLVVNPDLPTAAPGEGAGARLRAPGAIAPE